MDANLVPAAICQEPRKEDATMTGEIDNVPSNRVDEADCGVAPNYATLSECHSQIPNRSECKHSDRSTLQFEKYLILD